MPVVEPRLGEFLACVPSALCAAGPVRMTVNLRVDPRGSIRDARVNAADEPLDGNPSTTA